RGVSRQSLRLRLKTLAVLPGIEQPVDVVDPQTFELAFGYPAEDETVRCLENLGELDRDAGKIVDFEEAPIIDLVRCDAPEGDTVGLRLQEAVQGQSVRLVVFVLAVDLVEHGFKASG